MADTIQKMLLWGECKPKESWVDYSHKPSVAGNGKKVTDHSLEVKRNPHEKAILKQKSTA